MKRSPLSLKKPVFVHSETTSSSSPSIGSPPKSLKLFIPVSLSGGGLRRLVQDVIHSNITVPKGSAQSPGKVKVFYRRPSKLATSLSLADSNCAGTSSRPSAGDQKK